MVLVLVLVLVFAWYRCSSLLRKFRCRRVCLLYGLRRSHEVPSRKGLGALVPFSPHPHRAKLTSMSTIPWTHGEAHAKVRSLCVLIENVVQAHHQAGARVPRAPQRGRRRRLRRRRHHHLPMTSTFELRLELIP